MAKWPPPGRRKRPAPAFTRAHWAQHDTIQLLAWLDHSLKQNNINFDRTIVGHLKVASGKAFTVKQAKSKLVALWRYCGSDVAKDPTTIYRQGSSCLPGLADEEKEAIAAASLDLAHSAATIPLRGGRLIVRSTSSPRTQISETGSSKEPQESRTPRKGRHYTLRAQQSERNDQRIGESENLLSACAVSILSQVSIVV